MKVADKIQRIAEKGMSTKDKQRSINVSEVFHLWNHLVQRYSVINLTQIYETFAKDDDLRIILKTG